MRDPAHVFWEKNGEKMGRTLNSYANEAACHVARSVADKFSKKEDVLFPPKYFYGNFGEISPFTDDTKDNKMSWKEGEKTCIIFMEVQGMRGCYSGRWGGGVKTTY